MRWLPDDSQMVTAGADGAVYQWRLSDQRRVREHVVKVIFSSDAYTPICVCCGPQHAETARMPCCWQWCNVLPIDDDGMRTAMLTRLALSCQLAVCTRFAMRHGLAEGFPPTFMQGCIYSSAALTSGARSILATGSDRILRELEESTGGNTSASREVETGCQLTKLAVPAGGLPCLHACHVCGCHMQQDQAPPNIVAAHKCHPVFRLIQAADDSPRHTGMMRYACTWLSHPAFAHCRGRMRASTLTWIGPSRR